jgi:hypothetical protein
MSFSGGQGGRSSSITSFVYPRGSVVLETKTLGETIVGELDAPV